MAFQPVGQRAAQHQNVINAAEGRIASASRQDYAEAAATVMTQAEPTEKVYELAGDSRTLSKLIGRATTPWQETIAAALKG